MKKMTSSWVLGSVLAASVMSGSAMAGSALTGNVGVMSDYFFRGIFQSTGVANGGVDYDFGNNVAVGAWFADVNDGIEYDLYGAYSGKINQFDYSVGFTTYRYTGDYDETYNEINLGASTGPVSLEYSIGTYDSTPSQDYSFLALTFEQGGAYATYGTFGKDAKGSYIELGYGLESGGFDVGVALINSDKDLSNTKSATTGNPTSDLSMVFSLGKSFDL